MSNLAQTEIANLPGRGIKPLASFRAHARIALIVFIVTVLAGIPLVFTKGQVFYSATALVQVAPRYMKNVRDDGELEFPSDTQYRQFLEQQSKSVARYDIVRDALASLGDKAMSWHRPEDSERKSVDFLREALVVHSVPDTYMIEIQLQGKSKEGLAEVVNAVVTTYVERMRRERVFGADVRVRMLEARETEILGSIREKTEKRTALALQLGIGAFSGKEENPYDRVLGDLRSSLADARNKRFEAESQLKAFEANGETDIKTRSIQEAVLIDPGLSNLKANLFKRRADLLTQLSGLQPQHPVYAEVTAELKRIDSEVGSQTLKLKEQVQQSLQARYKASVDQSLRVEGNVKKELDDLEKKGAGFAGLYNQAMTLTYDIDQQRKELDTVRERLNLLAGEQNSFGFVRLVTPALPPEEPFGPGKKKILLAVLLAAALLMLATPVLIDLVDRRIRTVNDAEKALGIPALGWMVERTDQSTELFGNDLLRRMAGSLVNEQKRQGTRVYAFSSVKPGGGTSELLLSLARTLDAMGYRTLAVEANAFHRDSRYDGAGPGLADCLRGDAQPAACVASATADLPARVHIGDLHGQTHLDRVDRIADVTQAWGADFSFVLVDLPPLLLSADAEMLARNLEHLIVIVEANGIVGGELRRAGRHLERLDPEGIGIVVNRVRLFDGGGYLQGTVFEYLSGRKLHDYFSAPAWMLSLQAWWTGFQMRHPAIGAIGERVLAFMGGMSLRRRIQVAEQATIKAPKSAGATPLPVRKLLAAMLILSLLGAAGYALYKRPDVWVNLLSDVEKYERPIKTRDYSPRTPAAHLPSAHSDGELQSAQSAGQPTQLKIATELLLPAGSQRR